MQEIYHHYHHSHPVSCLQSLSTGHTYHPPQLRQAVDSLEIMIMYNLKFVNMIITILHFFRMKFRFATIFSFSLYLLYILYTPISYFLISSFTNINISGFGRQSIGLSPRNYLITSSCSSSSSPASLWLPKIQWTRTASETFILALRTIFLLLFLHLKSV